MANIINLPTEIGYLIISFYGDEEIINIQLGCKKFSEYVEYYFNMDICVVCQKDMLIEHMVKCYICGYMCCCDTCVHTECGIWGCHNKICLKCKNENIDGKKYSPYRCEICHITSYCNYKYGNERCISAYEPTICISTCVNYRKCGSKIACANCYIPHICKPFSKYHNYYDTKYCNVHNFHNNEHYPYQLACPSCYGIECSNCGSIGCKACMNKCKQCNKNICFECTIRCQHAPLKICDELYPFCRIDDNITINNCSTICCQQCAIYCVFCREGICTDHIHDIVMCTRCNRECCSNLLCDYYKNEGVNVCKECSMKCSICDNDIIFADEQLGTYFCSIGISYSEKHILHGYREYIDTGAYYKDILMCKHTRKRYCVECLNKHLCCGNYAVHEYRLSCQKKIDRYLTDEEIVIINNGGKIKAIQKRT